MANSKPQLSRMALLSLAVSIVWYVVAIAIFAIYWNPSDPPPQRWDRLVLMIILFWTWMVTGLLGTAAGITALIQIRRSEGRVTGQLLAIGGLVLAVLPGAVLVWTLYG